MVGRTLNAIIGAAAVAVAVAGTAIADEPMRTSFDLGGLDKVTRRVFLSVPEGQPPAQGYPVVYLIDGNTTFDLARQALAGAPEIQAVLVGIG